MQPRVLITGASGFVGRASCRLLRQEGITVFAGTRRDTGDGTFVPLSYPCDPVELNRVIEGVQPDYVLHLAGVSHGVEPAVFYQTNIEFAAALLTALRRIRRPCAVLLAGSAAEYGLVSSTDLPISEECATRPYNHYGISKLGQTLMGLTFNSGPLSVVVARTFNVLGPGMPTFLSIGSFVEQVAELTTRGRGTLRVGNLDACRDYVHVDDAVRAYWMLLREPAAYGRVINVCSGRPTKIGDIVHRLVVLAGGSILIETDPLRVKPIDFPVHFGSQQLFHEITGERLVFDLDKALRDALRGVGVAITARQC